MYYEALGCSYEFDMCYNVSVSVIGAVGIHHATSRSLAFKTHN
jgi:hypothetical protein